MLLSTKLRLHGADLKDKKLPVFLAKYREESLSVRAESRIFTFEKKKEETA
jgi:hypothetical protein